MSLIYRIRVWLGSLAWYVRTRPQETRVFFAPRVLPPREADAGGERRDPQREEPPARNHVRNWTPCRPGICDICDDRREQQWLYMEDT